MTNLTQLITVPENGVVIDIPDGSKLSPDAAWIRRQQWDSLSVEQQEDFAPLCPDFVVEIRSPSDNLGHLMEKMRTYVANGVSLAWLIDPFAKDVYVYSLDETPKCLNQLLKVRGEPTLQGFVLDMPEIWD